MSQLDSNPTVSDSALAGGLAIRLSAVAVSGLLPIAVGLAIIL